MEIKGIKINSKFDKSFSMIKLVYEIKKEKFITIFHQDFVQNNKSFCKMIINNKLCLLTDKYEMADENMKLLKVKLLILNDKKINFSNMLHECQALKEFHIISEEEEISKQEHKNENIKNKESFVDLNNQSNIVFLNSYNNITNIFNEALKIYNIYNDFYVDNENQKMNYISNLSDEILSSSNSSIKSDNNKYNEYNSFY